VGDVNNFDKQVENNSELSVLLAQSTREITQAVYDGQPYDYALSNEDASAKVSLSSLGPLSAIVGFQSPFNPERSVVAMMANNNDDLKLINNTLVDSGKLSQIRGNAIIINQYKVHNSYLGERYYIGSLPPFTYIWFHLSEHPLILAILTLITLLIISFVLWRILTALAKKRVESQE
jgi:hypothetical protein